MQVVKHIKDLKVSDELSRLMDYLNENVQSRVVIEKIKDKNHMLKTLKSNNPISLQGYFEAGASVKYFLRK